MCVTRSCGAYPAPLEERTRVGPSDVEASRCCDSGNGAVLLTPFSQPQLPPPNARDSSLDGRASHSAVTACATGHAAPAGGRRAAALACPWQAAAIVINVGVKPLSYWLQGRVSSALIGARNKVAADGGLTRPAGNRPTKDGPTWGPQTRARVHGFHAMQHTSSAHGIAAAKKHRVCLQNRKGQGR